jgi:hypothetical protein
LVESEVVECSCGCGTFLTGKQKTYASEACQKRVARDKQLQQHFGITLADYSDIFAIQEGKCWLCRRRSPGGRTLAVHHEHQEGQSGRVLALLCFRCNKYKAGRLLEVEVRRLVEMYDNPPSLQALGYVPWAAGRPKSKRKRQPRRRGSRRG